MSDATEGTESYQIELTEGERDAVGWAVYDGLRQSEAGEWETNSMLLRNALDKIQRHEDEFKSPYE